EMPGLRQDPWGGDRPQSDVVRRITGHHRPVAGYQRQHTRLHERHDAAPEGDHRLEEETRLGETVHTESVSWTGPYRPTTYSPTATCESPPSCDHSCPGFRSRGSTAGSSSCCGSPGWAWAGNCVMLRSPSRSPDATPGS